MGYTGVTLQMVKLAKESIAKEKLDIRREKNPCN
jgi:hypothetical protein